MGLILKSFREARNKYAGVQHKISVHNIPVYHKDQVNYNVFSHF